jgi:transposase
MNASYCHAGIDVCKDHLDVHLLPGKHADRLPNTAAGHRALIDLLESRDARLTVLEATGGYEHAAVVAMVCAGLRVHVAQPQVVRAFAKSLKLRAKNDDIDAAVCARYAQDRCDDLEIVKADETHDALRDLVSLRNDLVAARSAWKNRLKQAESQARNNVVVRELKRSIVSHTKQIERVEKELDATIKSDEALKAKANVLLKIKGVGPQTTRIVIALLPELGTVDSRRINSLVGVAPYASDSGDKRMKRHIAGGRMPVRNVLYMACLTAMRTNRVIRPYYDQMVARGMPHKSAMMACIRRMLAHMNGEFRVLPGSRGAEESATRQDNSVITNPSGRGARGLGAGGQAPKRRREKRAYSSGVCA